jgi:preprotein translocase subunit SecD
MFPRLLFALTGLCLAAPAQSPPPVTLAVHLLVACSAPGAGQPVRLPGVEASRCLDHTPFLTQNDVASAEIHTNSKGRPTVFLTFRDEAAVRELDITRRNVGNRVGIVVNGRIVSAPEVVSSSRLLYIDGNYTEKDAQALVAAFNKIAGLK